jgi:hypothetical protein
MFQKPSRRNRYAVLYRIATAERAETRERRITTFVEMLSRGDRLPARTSGRADGCASVRECLLTLGMFGV